MENLTFEQMKLLRDLAVLQEKGYIANMEETLVIDGYYEDKVVEVSVVTREGFNALDNSIMQQKGQNYE